MTEIIFLGGSSGDPGLLTLSGQKALAAADAVFYDRLINPLLLLHCAQDAKLIDVGKKPGVSKHPQAEITQQLLQAARTYTHIVRLKGGDPSVFGRLDEELSAVQAAAIPFRIIPGITAASALGAYSSLSLTKRGVSRGVTLITGAQLDEGDLVLDQLIQNQTLVVYMGVHRVAAIQGKLLTQFAKDLPVLIATSISYGRQQIYKTTLAKLAETVAAFKVTNPALFLLGAVAADYQSEKNWFEQQPLFGERLLYFSQSLDVDRTLWYAGLGADIWPVSLAQKRNQQMKALTQDWLAKVQPKTLLLGDGLALSDLPAAILPQLSPMIQITNAADYLARKELHFD